MMAAQKGFDQRQLGVVWRDTWQLEVVGNAAKGDLALG